MRLVGAMCGRPLAEEGSRVPLGPWTAARPGPSQGDQTSVTLHRSGNGDPLLSNKFRFCGLAEHQIVDLELRGFLSLE
jgi:hypothetical protein